MFSKFVEGSDYQTKMLQSTTQPAPKTARSIFMRTSTTPTAANTEAIITCTISTITTSTTSTSTTTPVAVTPPRAYNPLFRLRIVRRTTDRRALRLSREFRSRRSISTEVISVRIFKRFRVTSNSKSIFGLNYWLIIIVRIFLKTGPPQHQGMGMPHHGMPQNGMGVPQPIPYPPQNGFDPHVVHIAQWFLFFYSAPHLHKFWLSCLKRGEDASAPYPAFRGPSRLPPLLPK